MLVAAIVLMPNVPNVPLSVKAKSVCGVPELSLIVKLPLESLAPSVTTGLVADSVNGALFEKVSARSVVAPRVVTDSKVSASVPVIVMVLASASTETMLIPPPTMLMSLTKLLSELTKLPELVERQVGHEMVPVVLSKAIGPVAATAIVPSWFGALRIWLPVRLPRSKARVLLLALLRILVEASFRVLLVRVWVWLAKTKVSLALSAGIVAVLLDVGARLLIVVVLVVPRTN